MEEIIIKVFDFTEFPGPRYIGQGKSSGEQFYISVLKKSFMGVLEKINKGNSAVLILDLDGTAGYASSFLDECIGNLVYDFGEDSVRNNLKLITKEEPDWQSVIFEETIPQWEEKRIKGISRKSE